MSASNIISATFKDKNGPNITQTSIADDNSTVSVTVNETAYNTNGGPPIGIVGCFIDRNRYSRIIVGDRSLGNIWTVFILKSSTDNITCAHGGTAGIINTGTVRRFY